MGEIVSYLLKATEKFNCLSYESEFFSVLFIIESSLIFSLVERAIFLTIKHYVETPAELVHGSVAPEQLMI